MSVISKALWYIESHLTDDLSLEAIASSVGVSRFHLSRAFGVATGRPLAEYVRMRRLSEAAKRLADGAPDILHVALEAGYGSHEAFTRAFRQQFGATPEHVRAQAAPTTLQMQEPIRMEPKTLPAIAPPRLIQRDAFLIFGLSHHYNCKDKSGIPAQWLQFVPHLGHIQNHVDRVAYGVISNVDDAGNFDYICGVEVAEFPSQPAEFTRLRIAPQTYAVYRHADHISSIGASWNYIWNQGLIEAGHKAGDGPALERYGEEFDGRTGLGGCELWVPVKG